MGELSIPKSFISMDENQYMEQFDSLGFQGGGKIEAFRDRELFRIIKKAMTIGLSKYEMVEDVSLNLYTVVYDSHFRDPWVWPESSYFKLSFAPSLDDLGSIIGIEPIQNILRVRLISGRVPNIYKSIPAQTMDVGYRNPYLLLSLDEIEGDIYNSVQAFGPKGYFAQIYLNDDVTDKYSLEINKINGGDITFDPPKHLLQSLSIATCNQLGNQLDYQLYDGIGINLMDLDTAPGTTLISTENDHHLVNGDIVTFQTDSGDDIDTYLTYNTFVVTVTSATRFTIQVYSPSGSIQIGTDPPTPGDIFGYIMRYDLGINYTFEMISINPRNRPG